MSKVLSKHLTPKTWYGLTEFDGAYVWKDGNIIYYSKDEAQYVLNKATSTWSTKEWNGVTNIRAPYIWTDGENFYYSYGISGQYVLNKSTSTWETKTWNGLTNFYGSEIWTDGNNIYYSNNSRQYVLNKSTSTWEAKTWNGLTSFNADNIWTDGDNIYLVLLNNLVYSHYSLNKSTSTWTEITWYGLTDFYCDKIWGYENSLYYSDGYNQYELNRSTSTWEPITWTGRSYSWLNGRNVWNDGENVYCSDSFDNNYCIFDTVEQVSTPSIYPIKYSLTGSSITPTMINYDSTKVTVSGDSTASAMGDYTISFTPKTGYGWENGSTDTKSLNWSIVYPKYATKSNLSSIITKINGRLDNRYTKDEVDALISSGGGGGSYTLPIASSSTLGGIKTSNDFNIDSNGVLSIANSATNVGLSQYKSNAITDISGNMVVDRNLINIIFAWEGEIEDTDTILTLPQSYRPSSTVYGFALCSGDNGAKVCVSVINTNGTLCVNPISTGNEFTTGFISITYAV